MLAEHVVALVAERGVGGATAAAIAARAGVPERAVLESVAVDELVLESAQLACRAPVLPPAVRMRGRATLGAVLAELIAAHQGYVDSDPVRFAAIAQFATAAVFDEPRLRPILAARTRSACDAAAGWFALVRADGAGGLTRAAAESLVHDMNSIELVHLTAPDAGARTTAYRELRELYVDPFSGLDLFGD